MMLQRFAYSEFANPLFGERVVMAWADPRAPMSRLIGDEVLAIEREGAVRARQFGAGRSAAHSAMEQLGHVPRPVLQGAGEAPVWPPGLTGSISHTTRDSLAVVSDDPGILALGLKIGPATALDSASWPVVCQIKEMRWLASLGPSQRGHFAMLLKCIKEAAYKAQFQITGAAMNYHHVETRIDLSTNLFEVSLHPDLTKTGVQKALIGRFAVLSDCFIAGVEWRM
jgi:4'-phosphopantetheinyl transferase EntD